MLFHFLHVCLEDVKPHLMFSLGQVRLAELLLELSELQLGVVGVASQGNGSKAGDQKQLHDVCQ